MSTICKYCQLGSAASNRIKHYKFCNKFRLYGDDIIKSYDSCTIKSLSEKYAIPLKEITKFLKSSGVKIRNVVSHKNIDEFYFDEIDTAEKAWLVGLIAADGCITNKHTFGITQSGDNGYKLISYVRNLLRVTNQIYRVETFAQPCYIIRANSQKVTASLARYNIIPNKTLIYTFPYNIPRIYYKDFIRGYLEGDGCIGIYEDKRGSKKFRASFAGTAEFLKQCKEIIPVSCQIHKTTSKINEIIWNGRYALKFCEWLFSTPDLYLSYKYNIYKDYLLHISIESPKFIKYPLLKQQAKRLYDEGHKVSFISQKIKIDSSTIYRWRGKNFQ